MNKLSIKKIKKFLPKLIYFLVLILFSIVLTNHTITGDDEVIHDIKSMSWKKINRNFSQKPRVTQTEAYALVRYQEEHSRPNKEYILKLLYSILAGSIPNKIDRDEINTILTSSISFDKAIIRLSYWKFYHELSHKKLLN